MKSSPSEPGLTLRYEPPASRNLCMFLSLSVKICRCKSSRRHRPNGSKAFVVQSNRDMCQLSGKALMKKKFWVCFSITFMSITLA